MLPDETLLEMFYFYHKETITSWWWWKPLVDVCRRWRRIVFASPRYLDLRLFCTCTTPTRISLDIWPPFPIHITYSPLEAPGEGEDNIIAALEHHDRISHIFFDDLRSPVLERFAVVMQKPLPVLRMLRLTSLEDIAPVLPKAFLGGSTPRLLSFTLVGISFPALPILPTTASHLLSLHLMDIPISGYISPESMATCLAALPNLGIFSLGFRSPESRPGKMSPPPRMRAVLPALFRFEFKGISEYLEGLVAQIKTPLLNRLKITFFMDLIFDIPQLYTFISRAQRLKPLNSAEVEFDPSTIIISLGSPIHVRLGVRCEEPDWQVASMAQICRQLLPLISHVEQLNIGRRASLEAVQGDGMDSTQWQELFSTFTGVQNLHVSEELRPLVAHVLKGLTGESATQVLPALHSLFFKGAPPSGSIQEDIQAFVTARQDSTHPVDVNWE